MSAMITFAIYGGIIGMFYFFFIRPQNKQKKEIEEMRKNIKKGDSIVTIGGFLATVVNVESENLVIETKPNGENLVIKRWAVRQKIQK